MGSNSSCPSSDSLVVNNLLERQAVFGGDLLQEQGLALPVDNVALDLARQLAVHKIELVGKDVVDAHLRLKPLREVGEAAGQNAHLAWMYTYMTRARMHAFLWLHTDPGVRTYVYICVRMYTYAYVCIHMRTYVYICVRMCTYTPHTYACMTYAPHVHACMHACVRACVRAGGHAYMHLVAELFQVGDEPGICR